jgi:hypothetical protein
MAPFLLCGFLILLSFACGACFSVHLQVHKSDQLLELMVLVCQLIASMDSQISGSE